MYTFKGLAMLGFVNALEQHPSLFFPFMRYTEARLEADAVENIFHKFSPPGRIQAKRGLSYWQDYLLYVEDIKFG